MNNTSSPIILPFRGIMPKIDPSAFIAPNAVIIGDVVIGAETSVWFGAVIRGDMGAIRIGARSNIQDGTMVHVSEGGRGMIIGDDVTIGHLALLHDCIIESRSFVGMRAVMMDDSVIESGAVLAAGALLSSGKKVLKGQLWAGSPAKYWRDLTADEAKSFESRSGEYVELMKGYGKK